MTYFEEMLKDMREPTEEEREGINNYIKKISSEHEYVEIVRCKDCKKVETNNCPMYRAHFGYTDDDYCSCGKRKEGK